MELPENKKTYARLEKDVLKKKLTDVQFRVTQEAATEPPFKNEFWDFKGRGIYVDVTTGEPLFSSRDKFDSSCGWPAFAAGLEREALVEKEDRSHMMRRVEVRSRSGDSHLGHVFAGDHESPTGVRYCINSAALRFIPYEKMEEEGYADLMQKV